MKVGILPFLTTFAQLSARLKHFLGGQLLVLGIKEGLVECAMVCVKSVVILSLVYVMCNTGFLLNMYIICSSDNIPNLDYTNSEVISQILLFVLICTKSLFSFESQISRSPHRINQYESQIFAMNFCLLTLLVNIGKIKVLRYLAARNFILSGRQKCTFPLRACVRNLDLRVKSVL